MTQDNQETLNRTFLGPENGFKITFGSSWMKQETKRVAYLTKHWDLEPDDYFRTRTQYERAFRKAILQSGREKLNQPLN